MANRHKPGKRSKPPQKFCSYCAKDRAVSNFPESSDICKFCVNFEKAAQLTAPVADPLQAEKYPMPDVAFILTNTSNTPQDLGNQ